MPKNARRRDARKRRAYRSPVRLAHITHTRDRIIDALFGEIQSFDSISLPRIAARAQISVPTVYRHFRNSAELAEAAVEYFERKVSIRGPRQLADFLPFIPVLFEHFDRHEPMLRARLVMNSQRSFQTGLPSRTAKWATRMVEEDLPKLSARDRTRAAALVRVLGSASAWEVLRDSFGLTGEEAGRVCAWAVGVLRRELHLRPWVLDSPRPGKRALGRA